MPDIDKAFDEMFKEKKVTSERFIKIIKIKTFIKALY